MCFFWGGSRLVYPDIKTVIALFVHLQFYELFLDPAPFFCFLRAFLKSADNAA